jgi:hypothetical protein
MKTLTLFNTPVRINDDGMVCLTDMWRIAKARAEAGDNDFLGGRDIENLRPSKFKRLESTQLFIKELSKWDSKAHLETIQGKHGGTFGSRFVAYEFAGHIDPAFKVGVYAVLDNYFSGELISVASYMAEANMAAYTFNQEAAIVSDCARTLNYWGKGGRKAHLLDNKQQAENKLQIVMQYK